jgi:hypothetical protein
MSTQRRFAPDQLREVLLSSSSPSSSSSPIVEEESSPLPLWDVVLPRRLASTAALDGAWVVDDAKLPTCVAHVIPDAKQPGRGRISLFSARTNNLSEDEKVDKTLQSVLRDTVQLLSDSAKAENPAQEGDHRLVLTFGSLDRVLLPHVSDVLEEIKPNFRKTFVSPCGMWIHDGQDMKDLVRKLPPGVTIRPLQPRDAELVDSRWEYRSDHSLEMIRCMIVASEESFGGCVGITVDGQLVSWVLRYLDGTLGMVWTEPDYRNKGYAATVIVAAVQDVRHRLGSNDERMVAYIVDSNETSQNLFKKLQWRRVADADWAGFVSSKVSASKRGA